MPSRLPLALVALLVVTALGSPPGAAAPPDAAAERRPISECTTVEESGHYVLTTDLDGTGVDGACIRIEGRNVTVDGDGHAIRRGTIETATMAVDGIDVRHLTVRNLDLPNGTIRYAAAGGVVERNTVAEIEISDGGHPTIRDNRVTGAGPLAGGIRVADAGAEIRNNTVTDNDVGIRLGAATASVLVTGNRIVDNDVGVEARTDSPRVGIHRNHIDGNRIGVRSHASPVNATHNYWGASDGPSSHPPNASEAPFRDPETGTLADGDGDGIAAFTGDVASARFDPALDESPIADEAPTATPTAAATTTGAVDGSTTAGTTTADPLDGEGVPGFGPVATLLGLAAGILLRRR